MTKRVLLCCPFSLESIKLWTTFFYLLRVVVNQRQLTVMSSSCVCSPFVYHLFFFGWSLSLSGNILFLWWWHFLLCGRHNLHNFGRCHSWLTLARQNCVFFWRGEKEKCVFGKKKMSSLTCVQVCVFIIITDWHFTSLCAAAAIVLCITLCLCLMNECWLTGWLATTISVD